jgi:hypothetical protein
MSCDPSILFKKSVLKLVESVEIHSRKSFLDFVAD